MHIQQAVEIQVLGDVLEIPHKQVQIILLLGAYRYWLILLALVILR